MRLGLQTIATIILAGVLAVSAGHADAQSLAARIRAIRSAETPSDASAAYRAALRQDRTSLAAREAFVGRLIALDKPASALSAARLLVAMDEDNAIGWSAILLTHVQREQFADAIETLADHAELLKNRDGMPASAGRLVAWYRQNRRHSPRAFALRRKIDVIRSVFGADHAFRTARDEAAARQTQQQTEDRANSPARIASRRAKTATRPISVERNRASRRESQGNDQPEAALVSAEEPRQAIAAGDRRQDEPLIGVDNPPLNSEDFNIANGLQIGVAHGWGDSNVQGRLVLDPVVSNIFSGSVIGLRSVAAADGRYVTLSGGGGTFSHGTIQMIAIPTVILLRPGSENVRFPSGWANPRRRRAPRSDDPSPSQPTKPSTPSSTSSDQPLPPWQREPQKSAREEIVRKRLLERSTPARPTSAGRSKTTSPQRVRRSRLGWGRSSAGHTKGTWGNP